MSDVASARAIVDDLLARQWSLRTLTNNTHGAAGCSGGTRRDLACEVRASAIPEGYLAFLRVKPRVSTEEAASEMEADGVRAVPSLAEVLPVAATRAERQAAMAYALNAWHGSDSVNIDGSSTAESSSLSAAGDNSRSSASSVAALSELGFNQMPQSSAYSQPPAGANALPAWSFGAHVASGDSTTANKRSRVDAVRTFCDHGAPGADANLEGASMASEEIASTEPDMPPPRVARYAAPVAAVEVSQVGSDDKLPTASVPVEPEKQVPSYGQVVSSAELPMTRAERRAAMVKYFAAQQAL